MSNKQGQQSKTGNQESQGNQPHQKGTNHASQQEKKGGASPQQGGKTGPQPGSGRDKKGRLG